VHLLVALSIDAWRVQTPPTWYAAQDFAERSVEMAEGLDDAALLSQALGALANVLDGQSLLREHLAVAQRRLELSQKADFSDLREKIDAQRGIGSALMYVGEYDGALPYLQKAEELAREIQAPDQMANALGIRAQCLFRLDRWDEVLATEEQWREVDLRYTRERVGET
jgi:tetratricopeptide (TPR) repeat protein